MEKDGDKSFGVASTVLGIVGLVFSIIIFPGIIFGIVGLIFGIIQRRASKTKWATVGIILSIIAIIVALFLLWKLILLVRLAQQIAAQCMANPSMPGCEAFVRFASQGAAA